MVGARLVWGKCVCLTWGRRSEEQASDLIRIQGAAEGSPGKRAVLSSCFLQPSGTVFCFCFVFILNVFFPKEPHLYLPSASASLQQVGTISLLSIRLTLKR